MFSLHYIAKLGSAAGLVAVCLSFATRSATAALPQLPPKAAISGVKVRYEVAGTASDRMGKFTAVGNTAGFTDLSYTYTPLAGSTFSLTAFFSPSGSLLGSAAGTNLTVTGAGGVGTLFQSNVVYEAISVFAPYSPTPTYTMAVEFLWQKPSVGAGSLAALSQLPFIGVLVQASTAFTLQTGATDSFMFDPTNRTTGDKLFGSSMNAANVFMTPTPTAAAGGGLLALSVAIRRRRADCTRS